MCSNFPDVPLTDPPISENRIREVIKPEAVCVHESLMAGAFRLRRLGVRLMFPSDILPRALAPQFYTPREQKKLESLREFSDLSVFVC